jgi:hypothetical protein
MRATGRESGGGGGVKADMRMSLVEIPGGTQCKVLTELAVSGKAAQFGRGVMVDFSSKLVAEFADRLARELDAPSSTLDAGEYSMEDDAFDIASVIDARSMARMALPSLAAISIGLALALLWSRIRTAARSSNRATT